MLLDDATLIVFEVDASDDPDLRPRVPDQPVDVHRRLGITNQHPGRYQPLEASPTLRVDLGLVRIHVSRQVDLGPDHVEKA